MTKPSLDLFTSSRSHWTDEFVQSLKPNTPTQLPEGRTGQALTQYAKRTGKKIVVRKYEGSEWACMLSPSSSRGNTTTKTVKASDSQQDASLHASRETPERSSGSESTSSVSPPSFPEPFDKE